jgi:F0F1-type ATP synthase membrane subunit b/b'
VSLFRIMSLTSTLLISTAVLVVILFILMVALLFKGKKPAHNHMLENDIDDIKSQLNDVFDD